MKQYKMRKLARKSGDLVKHIKKKKKRMKFCHLQQHGQNWRVCIILSEISRTEKDKYHMFSLICGM